MNGIIRTMPLNSIGYDDGVHSSTMQRCFRIFGVVTIVSLMMLTFAYAGGTAAATTIEQGVKNGAHELYKVMTAVVLPIAAVCFAWNAFKVLFGGERGMEMAKKQMLTEVIVLALVYLAPLIVTEIGGWFSSSSSWNF